MTCKEGVPPPHPRDNLALFSTNNGGCIKILAFVPSIPLNIKHPHENHKNTALCHKVRLKGIKNILCCCPKKFL